MQLWIPICKPCCEFKNRKGSTRIHEHRSDKLKHQTLTTNDHVVPSLPRPIAFHIVQHILGNGFHIQFAPGSPHTCSRSCSIRSGDRNGPQSFPNVMQLRHPSHFLAHLGIGKIDDSNGGLIFFLLCLDDLEFGDGF